MLLSEKTPLVAVDIGTHSVKIAQIIGSPGKYALASFQVLPLEYEAVVDGVIKKPEVVVEAIRRLKRAEKIKTNYCVSSVAGEAVIIKKIKVPTMTQEELAENIAKEAEQYIPFDIDDVAIDFQILGPGDNGDEEEVEEGKMDILLVAVQKEIIDSRVDILKEAGLKPRIIDLDAFAVANALSISRDIEALGTLAVIDLGASFTHLNIMHNGHRSFSQDIPGGGVACTQKLMAEFKVEYSQAEAMKRGDIPAGVEPAAVIRVMAEAVAKIIEEIEKAFEFYSSTINGAVGRLFLTGGGALMAGVDELMAQKLGIPVEILNPMESLKIPAKFDRTLIEKMGPVAAVTVGLGIRKFDYR
jgi:type IV pilus assembly protein PilM